ncbi:LysM peptidoglycan-binding domain-containing protein [Mangrovimonas sp. AS39]|uniref:LysM peptidoglycan-binding domain-containing protein n=1 Tax=Mangrovimonas futianensis TaxID=2895523 RepID=UPI001E58D481|nr:LysM peptidoglycan-binding domain-containing protein [Mangrovimonas futianensis]MCF1191280.1 LysM peptidoglycan-binding domain-containing protein [Mangrovimonas futianensis]MCF1194975.1 LysM peptidoglycan-binding domain-containing protein [Mangrovimonas futianensis]
MKKIFLVTIFMLGLGVLTSVQAQNYGTHKVKQGETIQSIAKTYNVSTSTLYALNPDAKKELKPNTVLIVPKSGAEVKAEPKITKELVGFKEHRVKKKETLFSLSKEYQVEVSEIKKHNPDLYASNLKKGDKIKIPVYKTVEEVVEVVDNSKTKKYTVLPKEGKWRIAYKYGISVQELDELNPGIADTLDVGQVINVPNISAEIEKPIDNQYSYYKVNPKEGFYRLKIKLGLDQSQLEALNPDLKIDGLKEGMILKVPYDPTLEANGVAIDTPEVSLDEKPLSRELKHIAVMLPFKLNKLEMDSIQDTKEQMHTDPFLNMSLDFYSGVVVAFDSLQKLGVNLKVDTYDTKNQISTINEILRDHSFENVDAVIGPLMPSNIERVASELKAFNVPVISPVTKNVQLFDNVFQSRPSEDLLYNTVLDYFKADSLIQNTIIISDQKHTKAADELKRQFMYASQVFSRKDKEGKDAFYVLDDDILSRLKEGVNLVFLESDNPGFISNVTSKLNSMTNLEDKSIILATTNMNDAFRDDEVSNYHLSNLQFHFPSIAKSYSEDDQNPFVKAYEKRFDITPNKVATRGFDLTMDVVLRLVTSPDLYQSVIDAPMTEYVENKFAYKKKLFGGYYNDTSYLVKYDNLKIVVVK